MTRFKTRPEQDQATPFVDDGDVRLWCGRMGGRGVTPLPQNHLRKVANDITYALATECAWDEVTKANSEMRRWI